MQEIVYGSDTTRGKSYIVNSPMPGRGRGGGGRGGTDWDIIWVWQPWLFMANCLGHGARHKKEAGKEIAKPHWKEN